MVRSEHLTHQGHLFGGDLMAEIDTVGYCLLRKKYGDKTLVTRAAEISFERPAQPGDVITFDAKIARVGKHFRPGRSGRHGGRTPDIHRQARVRERRGRRPEEAAEAYGREGGKVRN